MKLRLLAWSPLLNANSIDHGLLLPIHFHCGDDAGRPILDSKRLGPRTPSFAREAWRDIAPTVEAIRQYWMPSQYNRRDRTGGQRVCPHRLPIGYGGVVKGVKNQPVHSVLRVVRGKGWSSPVAYQFERDMCGSLPSRSP